MNDEQQAAQSIGKFLQLIKGLGELKPGLESLGSVKQAEQETKSRLSALKIDEAALVNKTQQLRAEVGELEKKANNVKAQGKADGEAELKRAKAEGEKLLEKAKTEAGSVMHKAQQKLVSIQEETEAVQIILNETNTACKAAKQRLDQTNAELDRIVQRAGGRGGS